MFIRACHLSERFLRCQSGATAIEYALIGSLIALVIIIALRLTGTSLNRTFTSVSTAFSR